MRVKKTRGRPAQTSGEAGVQARRRNVIRDKELVSGIDGLLDLHKKSKWQLAIGSKQTRGRLLCHSACSIIALELLA